MADVVQLEHLNKMNARNVAMVFAPNMTQVSKYLSLVLNAHVKLHAQLLVTDT